MINLTQILRLTNHAVEKALTSSYMPQKKALAPFQTPFQIYAPVLVNVKSTHPVNVGGKKNPA